MRALACLVLFVLVSPFTAREAHTEEVGAREREDRTLCARVAESPLRLEEAVRRGTEPGGIALSARFVLDDAGLLRLEVISSRDGTLHRARGTVDADGWDATDEVLVTPEAVAEAARQEILLSQLHATIATVGAKALGARDAQGRSPSHLIAVAPALRDGEAAFEVRVVVDGLPWTTVHDADGTVVAFRRPPYLEEREEALKRWEGRALPEIELPGGIWLNVEEPMRLAAWRGAPVLVLLTDPG